MSIRTITDATAPTAARSPASKANRTVPLAGTLECVPRYPDKLKIYRIHASPYWQARCYDNGRTIKRSTQTTDKREAIAFAKSLYDQIAANKYTGVAQAKQTRFDICATKMLESQQSRVVRREISEQAHQNDIYMLNAKILPEFRSLDVSDITHDVLDKFVITLGNEKLSASSIQRYLGIVRKVLQYAANRNLLASMPVFPKIKQQDAPRGWFTLSEYNRLWRRAKALIGTEHDVTSPSKSSKRDDVRKLKITADLYNMIVFMTNAFIRPTDVKNMQHKHVEIVRNDRTYLRLTLPESKGHNKPIATMARAVNVYERQKALYAVDDLDGPDGYVFMPQYKNRQTALKRLQQQFNFLLDDLNMKTGLRGEERTIYSLRHTSIMYRLLYGDGIDMLTLARNARTSVDMIDRFYASELTGEINIDAIQSQRRRKQKNAAVEIRPTNDSGSSVQKAA